jgi:hypothetical protein
MNNLRSLRVGYKLGPFEYTITREMADMHLAAIDNQEPLFKNFSAAGPRMIPPCFTTRDYIYLLVQKNVWGSGGILTHQESEFYNPGRIGQRVVCTGMIAERYVKKGSHYLVIEYQIDDINWDPLAKHRMTAQIF